MVKYSPLRGPVKRCARIDGVLIHPFLNVAAPTKGMDATSLISALVGAQTGEFQLAVAGKMARMNADGAASAAKLIDAAQRNIDQLANVAAGLGTNLDVSA